jgi:hypothetical protein
MFAAGRAVQDVRVAKTVSHNGKPDWLLLANAVATVLVVVTGGAIAFRDLRKERAK